MKCGIRQIFNKCCQTSVLGVIWEYIKWLYVWKDAGKCIDCIKE